MLTAGKANLEHMIKMAEDNFGSVSHKGEKVCSYSAEFKLEVIQHAQVNSNHAASRR